MNSDVLSLKIAVIVEGLIPSAIIGVINPLNYLRKTHNVAYDVFYIRDLLKHNAMVNANRYDVAIFVRILSRDSINKVLVPFLHLKKKIIYILDDDFENLNPNTEIGRYFRSFNPKENIKTFCSHSDHVVVSSQSLFDRYKSYSKLITIIPGFVNFDKINTIKTSATQDKNVIVIGYASSDHNYINLKQALPALRRILLKYDSSIRFEIFFKEMPNELRGIFNVVKINPIENIDKFYEELSKRGWDIGIAPLEDNVFNKSKSNLKYREYASFGIAGIYSDVDTYRDSVIHGDTGIITKNTEDDWVNAFEDLIQNKEKRKKISELSNRDINEKYSMEKVSSYYVSILKSVS